MTEEQHPQRRFNDRHYDDRLAQLDAEIAEVRAGQLALKDLFTGMSHRLEEIGNRVNQMIQPRYGLIATGLVGVATILISIGILALEPHTQAQRMTAEALNEITALLLEHVRDGHPASVRQALARLDENLKHRLQIIDEHHREKIARQSNELDALEQRDLSQDILLARLNEREQAHQESISAREKHQTELLNLRARDRWTASMQQVYAQAVEQRLRALEKQQSEVRKQ